MTTATFFALSHPPTPSIKPVSIQMVNSINIALEPFLRFTVDLLTSAGGGYLKVKGKSRRVSRGVKGAVCGLVVDVIL